MKAHRSTQKGRNRQMKALKELLGMNPNQNQITRAKQGDRLAPTVNERHC